MAGKQKEQKINKFFSPDLENKNTENWGWSEV